MINFPGDLRKLKYFVKCSGRLRSNSQENLSQDLSLSRLLNL